MSADQSYLSSLCDEKHVVGLRKSDEAKQSPCAAFEFHTTRALVTVFDGVEKLAHLSPVVDDVVLEDAQKTRRRCSINLQNPEVFLHDILSNKVKPGAGFVQGKAVHVVYSIFANLLVAGILVSLHRSRAHRPLKGA